MNPRFGASNFIVCLLALTLAFLGTKFPPLKRLCGYLFALVVMIYACSIAGLFLSSLVKTHDYLPAGIGFFGGVAVGVVLGIALGRAAESNAWLYWLLAGIVAFVIAWLKPLF